MTNHKDCPQFKKMMMYAIDNAKQLSGKQDLLPGQYKFGTLRKTRFETLLAAIDWRVRVTKDYWKAILGRSIPFIIVCQDVWESNKKDVLGVTIMFLDPAG